MATRQEMRSYVCGQCHVTYYFRGPEKTLTFPWTRGLKVEDIITAEDESKVKEWEHPQSGAPLIKARHPEFEVWNMGVHSRSGVACADCHMPYTRMGGLKISDHHVKQSAAKGEPLMPDMPSFFRRRTQAARGRNSGPLLQLAQHRSGRIDGSD